MTERTMAIRFFVWIAAGVLTIGSTSVASPSVAPSRPNILMIIVDDMRYDQMTHEGHPYIQTPNLDRMAEEGMRFTNSCVTSPLCGPCRSSVYSGRQPSAHGRIHNFADFDMSSPYLPKMFHDAGYTTAFMGKFYEGGTLLQWARENAWDHWHLNGGPYWPDYTGDPDDDDAKMAFYQERLYYDQYYNIDGETRQVIGHQTDVLFHAAADFAATAEAAGKPFWIALNPFAPHTPLNPSLQRKDKYKGMGLPDRPNMELDKGTMANAGAVETMTHVHEATCEMIEDIDSALGVLLGTLEQNGQLDNTLIIFTSDNGVLHGEHGYWWKMSHWQESIHVPLLIRYPEIVGAGTVSDALVSLADMLITCADVGGVSLPDDSKRYGRSFLPVLTDPDAEVRDGLLCMQYEQIDGVIPDTPVWVTMTDTSGWKLVVYRDGPVQRPDHPGVQLYNVKTDPFEMTELASDPGHLVHVARLSAMLREQLTESDVPIDWLDVCCDTSVTITASSTLVEADVPVTLTATTWPEDITMTVNWTVSAGGSLSATSGNEVTLTLDGTQAEVTASAAVEEYPALTDDLTVNLFDPATFHLKINAGAGTGDVDGWEGSRSYVTGGSVYNFGAAPSTSGVECTAPAAVYQSVHHSPGADHSFDFDMPDGQYTVRMHFYDTHGDRSMEFLIEGISVLSDFSPTVNTAVVKEFLVDVSDGLRIEAKSHGGDVFLAGIEVLAGNNPCGPVAADGSTRRNATTAVPMRVIKAASGGFLLKVNAESSYRIDIFDMRGAVVKSFFGKGVSRHVWDGDVAAGIYTAGMTLRGQNITAGRMLVE